MIPSLPAVAGAAQASALAGSLLHPFQEPVLLASFGYALTCNVAYLARRSQLRQMTMTRLFEIRTQREDGVTFPMYCTFLVAWQTFVLFLFPITEPVGKMFGYCSFYYSYPKANGGGYILEPLSVQRLSTNQRTKAQVRFDWHRFTYNVGDIGRDGYRHPPKLQRNLPHIDLPSRGVKHWPWRRRHVTDFNRQQKEGDASCETEQETQASTKNHTRRREDR